MVEERRKHKRYKCLLPAEDVKAEGKDIRVERFIKRFTVHDFSRGGLKLVINFIPLNPGSDMELTLYVPETGIKTSLKAEIAWKKADAEKLELGLKIKDMEEEAKNEILSLIAPSES